MYNIIGESKYGTEVIDTAGSRLEAIKLVKDYQLALGNEWIIKFKKK